MNCHHSPQRLAPDTTLYEIIFEINVDNYEKRVQLTPNTSAPCNYPEANWKDEASRDSVIPIATETMLDGMYSTDIMLYTNSKNNHTVECREHT